MGIGHWSSGDLLFRADAVIISDSDRAKLNEHFNWPDILSALGLGQFPHDGEWKLKCAFCCKLGFLHLRPTLAQHQRFWFCDSCGRGGDMADFIAAVLVDDSIYDTAMGNVRTPLWLVDIMRQLRPLPEDLLQLALSEDKSTKIRA